MALVAFSLRLTAVTDLSGRLYCHCYCYCWTLEIHTM